MARRKNFLSVEVKGTDQAAQQIDALGFRLGERTLYEEIYDTLLENERAIWRRDGTGSGRKWKPLSRRYVLEKARSGHQKGILRRTGALERSLTNKGDSNQRKRIDGHGFGLTFGTKLKVANLHQGGKKGSKRHRPVMGFTPKVRKGIAAQVLDYQTRHLS